MRDKIRSLRKVMACLTGVLLIMALLIPAGGSTAFGADAQSYDVLIKGGTVYDGTLKPPCVEDIAVQGDRIVAIGKLEGKAAKTIDAQGFIVTPGFIDIHEHSDMIVSMLASGEGVTPAMKEEIKGNLNAIYQGVTTVVTGNCGNSATDTAQWFKMVESMNFGTNVMHLIPHGAVRFELFGEKNQPLKLSPKQLKKFKARIEKEMKNGACGISTGLSYPPGLGTTTEELIDLAKVVGKYGGIYATHMRDESGTLLEGGNVAVLESIKEAIEIGRKSGTPVQISHLKLAVPHSIKASRMLTLIEAARQEGLDVTADSYPYTSGVTGIEILLPNSFKKITGGIADRYKTKEERAEIKALIQGLYADIPPEKIILISCDKKEYEGKSVGEIAAMEGKDPSDTYVGLVCDHVTTGIIFAHNEQAMKDFMSNHYVFTCSDGYTWARDIPGAHPRIYGAFTRKLKVFALEEKILSLNDAIRSMTLLPAEKLGIAGRGKLESGAFADIVVMDLNTLKDKSTYENPAQYAEGVVHLMVNGVLTIEDRKLTGQRAGRPLKGRGRPVLK
ncbi:MAG: D-aminoacylase [Smithella sp. PtaU1.Bin162]|nr:MAG: D-aminoacylase [Smithella sp. PtaU1.Bin162]